MEYIGMIALLLVLEVLNMVYDVLLETIQLIEEQIILNNEAGEIDYLLIRLWMDLLKFEKETEE